MAIYVQLGIVVAVMVAVAGLVVLIRWLREPATFTDDGRLTAAPREDRNG